MRRQHVKLDVAALNVQRRGLADQLDDRVRQRTTAENRWLIQFFSHASGGLGQRHQPRTRALMQRLDECLHLVLQHSGHQPFAAFFIDLIQGEQRHIHRYAVFCVTRFVQVSRAAVHTTEPHGFRKSLRRDSGRFVTHQFVAGEQQQLRLLFYLSLVPAFKAGTAANIGRQLLVVKGVYQLFIDQHVLPARLVLQVLHLGNQLVVGSQKRQFRVPVAGYQCLANENFTRGNRVNPAKVDPAAVVDHQAIQRGALQRCHLRGLLFPVRVEQLFFQQVTGHLLDPLRLDVGDAATKQARGFHQFSRHNPTTRLLAELGAGVTVKADAACAQIPVLVIVLQAHIAQQPAQHRQVQLLITGWLGVQHPALFADGAL